MENMHYVMDASEKERHRLEVQAALLEPFTRRFLAEAGLAKGLSVLDIGTGAGDVAFLAASMVGSSGRVLGVDCEARMVEHARRRAQAKDLANVQFQIGSLRPEESLGEFDFVVGRLVTAYQPDQISFVRHAASLVKANGRMALIETGWNLCGAWASPALPLFDELLRSAGDIAKTLGFDSEVGSHLVRLFAQAGLREPSLLAELLVGAPGSSLLDFNLLNIDSAFALGRLKGFEVPDQATVNARCAEIRETAVASRVQFSGPCFVGAWTRIG